MSEVGLDAGLDVRSPLIRWDLSRSPSLLLAVTAVRRDSGVGGFDRTICIARAFKFETPRYAAETGLPRGGDAYRGLNVSMGLPNLGTWEQKQKLCTARSRFRFQRCTTQSSPARGSCSSLLSSPSASSPTLSTTFEGIIIYRTPPTNSRSKKSNLPKSCSSRPSTLSRNPNTPTRSMLHGCPGISPGYPPTSTSSPHQTSSP